MTLLQSTLPRVSGLPRAKRHHLSFNVECSHPVLISHLWLSVHLVSMFPIYQKPNDRRSSAVVKIILVSVIDNNGWRLLTSYFGCSTIAKEEALKMQAAISPLAINF